MKPVVVRGGRVIDPGTGHDGVADLVIVDGKIAGLGRGDGIPDGADVVDAEGLVVAPGLVDLHVHFREPG
ncbi:MAG TPA: dihydroorotase, partial [Gemmatimonadales bacterium]|nr:dihydroorotase [Gemmatimonadales bacterium]